MDHSGVSQVGSRPSKSKDKEKNRSVGTGSGTRYKEKFQALREKYELVTQAQQLRQKELEVATGRMKGLQEEIDMLLDAFIEMAHASPVLRIDEPPPAQPTREEYAARRRSLSSTRDQTPHRNSEPSLFVQHPLGSHTAPPPLPQANYTNGTTNGKRKRRRITEDDADTEEEARRGSNMAFITEIINPHER
ncbi:hypothetical protein E1B28_008018 [Marasmius oreades]|uniref:Uncharacterized protein n=1 Tax=Marasmius oreades TaxID=181124 RepID=A0A9P7S3C3_9AGAR|nr:uncharacterized protein E1B28_008018 [Marasmius oreades]KAG7094418.1 hypothetical protein E1B28_008018 [Marasmius oreades]